MVRINLQLFAHKKGMGSTKNGRDSESKRLGVKRGDGQMVSAGSILVGRGVPGSIPVLMWEKAVMIHCSPS